jgi:hypothetical protein
MIDRTQQLHEQLESAKICEEATHKAWKEHHSLETLYAYLSAADSRVSCEAELDKFLWLTPAVAA